MDNVMEVSELIVQLRWILKSIRACNITKKNKRNIEKYIQAAIECAEDISDIREDEIREDEFLGTGLDNIQREESEEEFLPVIEEQIIYQNVKKFNEFEMRIDPLQPEKIENKQYTDLKIKCELCRKYLAPRTHKYHRCWLNQRFKCINCKKEFSTKENLNKHVKNDGCSKSDKVRCPRCQEPKFRTRIIDHWTKGHPGVKRCFSVETLKLIFKD